MFVNLLVWCGLEMDHITGTTTHASNIIIGLDRLHDAVSCSRAALSVFFSLDIKRNDASQAACYEHSESCWSRADVSESVSGVNDCRYTYAITALRLTLTL